MRSVTDLRNRRIYLKQEAVGMHTPRTILLQALGHFVLGHDSPRDFADFLRQRVEANYFAAAVLVPEQAAAAFLAEAKQARELSVEDLRDVFSVSYEMAAHRFTNLATHHLGLPCHFVKNDESGIIYKAYENDGLVLPADETGAIEGQRMCRKWAGRQIFAADGPLPPTASTPTPRRAPTGASPTSTPAASAGSRSRSAPRTSTPAGSAAGTRSTDVSRGAPTATAASARRPRWPRAGRDGVAVGPRALAHPVRAPTGASPAWTRPTCTSSSTSMRRDDVACV